MHASRPLIEECLASGFCIAVVALEGIDNSLEGGLNIGAENVNGGLPWGLRVHVAGTEIYRDVGIVEIFGSSPIDTAEILSFDLSHCYSPFTLLLQCRTALRSEHLEQLQ